MNKIGILILFFAFIAKGISAQNEKRAIATIPFTLLDDKYVLIRPVINDKDTLTFYFDTGATAALLDRSTAEKIGVKANYSQGVEGASGSKKYEIALNQSLSFDSLKIGGVHCVLEDMSRLNNALSYHFDGVVGASILSQYKTELDFDTKVIRLYNPDTKLDLEGYTAHSFTFDNQLPIPQLDLTLKMNNGKSYTGKVFFDSGAGLTVMVNTPYKEKYQLAEGEKVLKVESNDLNGKSTSEEIAIKGVEFCGYQFPEMPITLSSDKAGVSSYFGYLGILGSDIINRFNMVLDYVSMTIYLKPNNLYDKPFKFPVSGIVLRKNEDGNISVYSVQETSNAYKSGIRKGDIVLSVNRQVSDDIREYYKLLDRDGRKVKIKVLNHEGKKKDFKFMLKRLI